MSVINAPIVKAGISRIERDKASAAIGPRANDGTNSLKRAISTSIMDAARAQFTGGGDSPADLLIDELAQRSGARKRRASADIGSDNEGINAEQLAEVVENLGAEEKTALDALKAKFPYLTEESNPLAKLQQAGTDAGAAALLLSSLIAELAGGDSERKKRLKDALAELLRRSQDDLSMGLFSFLSFGENAQRLEEMKSLYRKATDGCTMSEMFHKLLPMPNRDAKLRALIRAMSYELTSMGYLAQGTRLFVMVKEMHRLLLFLGLSKTCDKVADDLKEKNAITISSDGVMTELLKTSEQAWLDADWINMRFSILGAMNIVSKIVVARSFRDIWKNLPLSFYEDEERRDQVLIAFENVVTHLAEEE